MAKCTSYTKLGNKIVRIPQLCSNASSGKTAQGNMHSETADSYPQLAPGRVLFQEKFSLFIQVFYAVLKAHSLLFYFERSSVHFLHLLEIV